jgi:hypothetical protein
MPIEFVIDRFRQQMWTRAEGVVTYADLCAHLESEAREHGVDLPELFDARDATTDIDSKQIRRLVDQVHRMVQGRPFGPTAIVTLDEFAFGMARMFSILVENAGVSVEVFRDVESGRAWLDKAAFS